MSEKDEFQDQYSIELFNKNQHKRSNFSCGNNELDRYLKKHANQELQIDFASPFVLVKDGQRDVLGYYTLSSFSIRLESLPPNKKKRLPHYPRAPATLIGRFAVDKNYQGRGLGEFLLMDALRNSYKGTSEVASHLVVVEPKEGTKDFYMKNDFEPFPDPENDGLYLPMDTIEEIFEH